MNEFTNIYSAVKNLLDFLEPYFTHPLVLLTLFMFASLVMTRRLEIMENKGFEGTILGTLIMPYCSGFPNLMFALVMSRSGNRGDLVIENSIVNNVTNLTLILGLAILLGPGRQASNKKLKKKSNFSNDSLKIHRLNLLLTLIALFLFTGTLWALGGNQEINFYDGTVLIGLFVFWQILHVFEVLKDNIRKKRSFQKTIFFDLLLIALCAFGIYYSVDRLVEWVSKANYRYINVEMLGWLSGLLMVLPNAFIALYYARLGRQDIVFSSQIGDAHICIPMCIGLFAIFNSIQVPVYFQQGMFFILSAGIVHFLSIAFIGRVPRLLSLALIGSYGGFMYTGIIL